MERPELSCRNYSIQFAVGIDLYVRSCGWMASGSGSLSLPVRHHSCSDCSVVVLSYLFWPWLFGDFLWMSGFYVKNRDVVEDCLYFLTNKIDVALIKIDTRQRNIRQNKTLRELAF